MEYQQNLHDLQLAIIVMVARNTELSTLRLLMPAVMAALQTIRAGEVVHVQL